MTRVATVERLQSHLPLDIGGYKASSELIPEVILDAAIIGSSMEPSCGDLDVHIGTNLAREQLNACLRLETLADLEAKVNAALAERPSHEVGRAAGELAIDLYGPLLPPGQLLSDP